MIMHYGNENMDALMDLPATLPPVICETTILMCKFMFCYYFLSLIETIYKILITGFTLLTFITVSFIVIKRCFTDPPSYVNDIS